MAESTLKSLRPPMMQKCARPRDALTVTALCQSATLPSLREKLSKATAADGPDRLRGTGSFTESHSKAGLRRPPLPQEVTRTRIGRGGGGSCDAHNRSPHQSPGGWSGWRHAAERGVHLPEGGGEGCAGGGAGGRIEPAQQRRQKQDIPQASAQ